MTRLVGLCWLVFWGLLVGGLACCCYGVPYGHAVGLFGVLGGCSGLVVGLVI